MLVTRKIGKIIRGKATPYQIIAAAVLGSLIAFIPGILQAPGLVLLLLIILAVLNANLGIAAIVGLLAKLASLLLMPLSFHVGRLLLDGPTSGLFRSAINAPVLAYFGFDYYAVTGGIVVGALFGIAMGILLVRFLMAFRRKMATLEEGSDRYKAYTSKWWVKATTFIVVGGKKGKKSWADLTHKRMGNPVRPIGVVFAGLLVALVFLVQLFLTEELVTAAMRSGLERANGATVDLNRADLSLGDGRLEVEGLAMADPNALETDLLRAARLEATLSTRELLRKRITFDRIEITDASSGEERRIPGRRVGPQPRPRPEPPAEEDEKTLDDYIEQARAWRERLAQLRNWLEKIEGSSDEEPPTDEDGRPVRETLRERLAREVAEKGYARVRASHLVEDSPTVLVREIEINGLRTPRLEGETFDLRAASLSTQPPLVTDPPTIRLTSRSDRIAFDAVLAAAAADPGSSTIAFRYDGLDADRIASLLRVPGDPPMRGGTVDLAFDGTIVGGAVDAPLRVAINNSTLGLPGVGATEVDRLVLPIGVRGPLDAPRIRFDDDALAQALIDAGKAEAARRIRGELDRATERIRDQAGERAGDAIGRFLGGRDRDNDNDPDSDD